MLVPLACVLKRAILRPIIDDEKTSNVDIIIRIRNRHIGRVDPLYKVVATDNVGEQDTIGNRPIHHAVVDSLHGDYLRHIPVRF